jgi:hypothetical protein
MRRRGLPIVWIGFIAILIAFVVWYGWQTNIAPYIAEQRAQQQQSEPQQAVPVPREEEIKAQLQRNQAAISAQPEPKATTQNRTEACYAAAHAAARSQARCDGILVGDGSAQNQKVSRARGISNDAISNPGSQDCGASRVQTLD